MEMNYFQSSIKKDPVLRNKNFYLACIELFFYPWTIALAFHRVNHAFDGLPIINTLITQLTRFLTGVEIHSGARIGKNVFCDHAHSVVIGQTAVIEDNVMFYHGLTLGGLKPSANGKRHPTIKKGVIIGCNATILGPIEIDYNVKAGSIITE